MYATWKTVVDHLYVPEKNLSQTLLFN